MRPPAQAKRATRPPSPPTAVAYSADVARHRTAPPSVRGSLIWIPQLASLKTTTRPGWRPSPNEPAQSVVCPGSFLTKRTHEKLAVDDLSKGVLSGKYSTPDSDAAATLPARRAAEDRRG